MADRIKGITVEIGGDTTGLSKALSGVNKEISSTQKELKDVERLLKMDPGNVELLRQKYELLNKSIDTTESKLDTLKEAEKQVQAQFQRGDIGEAQYNALKREIIETESNLRKLKNQVKMVDNAIVSIDENPIQEVARAADDAQDSLKDAGKEATNFGDYLKADAIIGGIKSIANSIADLAEETKEYRKIMASLEVSSQNAGYTADETAESYRTLYSVLSDDQTAATTTANLQAIGLSQQDLRTVINATIGAWATYGDSIPIDSLSEAINETIQTGKVTGAFADVLNWAGISEDEFNKKLEAANSSTERAKIVLQQMTSQGLDKAGKAWQENNKDITEANKNTLDFQESLAELSRKTAPLTNAIQSGLNGIFKKSLDLTKKVDFDKFAREVDKAFGFLIDKVIPSVFDFVDFILENKNAVIGAISGVGAALVSMKAVEIITKIINVTKQAVTAINAAKTAQQLWNLAMNSNVIGIVASAVGLLVGGITALCLETDEATEAQKRQREEMELLRTQSEELAESYSQVKDASANKAMADLAEIENVKNLYSELESLVDANGQVQDANKGRASFILGELNDALGTEYTMTGNQIDQYLRMKDSIYELIEAKRMEILMQQAEENYAKAIENRAEAQDLFAESTRQLNETEEELARLREQRAQLYLEQQKAAAYGGEMEWIMAHHEELTSLEYSIEEQEKLLAEKQAAYDKNATELEQYYTDISLYEEAASLAMSGETEKVLDLLEKQNAGFVEAKDLSSKTEKEKREVLGEQYAKSLEILEHYAQKYTEGTEGYTEETLKILQKNAENAKKEWDQVASDSVDGYIEGINGRKWKISDTINNLFKLIPSWARNILGIHSPSKVMMEIGEYSGEGYDIGLEDSLKKSKNTMMRMFDFINKMQNSIYSSGDLWFPSLFKLNTSFFKSIYGAEPLGVTNSIVNMQNNSQSYPKNTTNLGGINMVVYGAPGQDVTELADIIMDKIESATQRKAAIYA